MRFLNHEVIETLIPVDSNVNPSMPLYYETLSAYKIHLEASNPDNKYVIKDNKLFWLIQEVIELYPRIDNIPNRLQRVD